MHRSALHSAACNLFLTLAVIVRPFATLDVLRFNAVCLGSGKDRPRTLYLPLAAGLRFVWCHIGPCDFFAVGEGRPKKKKIPESSLGSLWGKMAASHSHLPRLSSFRQGRKGMPRVHETSTRPQPHTRIPTGFWPQGFALCCNKARYLFNHHYRRMTRLAVRQPKIRTSGAVIGSTP